jgi:hypothetical protein
MSVFLDIQRRCLLTPVGDDGLELLELRGPFGKGRELEALELGGNCVAHGSGGGGCVRRALIVATCRYRGAPGRWSKGKAHVIGADPCNPT